MPQKLIIDADPGIGDAVAIALAILDPEIELLAVTATAGCVSGRQASRNVLALIDHLDPSKRPRIGVCDDQLATAELTIGGADIRWERINGQKGLGDWEPQVAELHNARDSAKLLVELVKEYPNEITLLTLGPLTNVELAAEKSRDFLDGLSEIICLGGNVEGGGDVTAAAEFNVYMNPLAARTILRSRVTKTLVPLDVCRKVTVTVSQYERVMHGLSGPVRDLFEKLLPYLFRASHEVFGVEGLILHEVVALAAATRPALFGRTSMAIDVETSGELTRGMTVFDRRGQRQWQANIDVLRTVEGQGVLDYVMRVLQTRTA
ncbi:MAG: nucleoside hydrolase [Planctomycetota bacterium]|nr:nucleoside hydrolase [Planctomycetaceae bacterium]MDQ3333102.1 nucleoside hydrolase [Planctomycetota bacterium]